MSRCCVVRIGVVVFVLLLANDHVVAEDSALAAAGNAHSTISTNGPILLSLDACVALALHTAETAGQLDGAVPQAEAQLRQAHSDSLPQLHLSPQIRAFVNDSSSTDVDFGIDLGERFLEIPQNLARRRIARGRLDQAEQRARRTFEQHAVKVQLAYLRCLSAQEDVQLAHARLESARAAGKAWKDIKLEDLELAGQKTMATLEARHAKDAYGDYEALEDACFGQLATLCGLDTHDFLLEELPRYAFPNISLSQCLSWWRDHRTDVIALEKQVTMMSEVIHLARLGHWPRARMGLGYDDGHSDSEFDDDPQGAFAMFALSIPIWDAGHTRARIDESVAQRDALLARMAAMKNDIPSMVTDAYLQLRKSVQAFERMRADPKPERRFEEAKAQFDNGDISDIKFAAERLVWDSHCADIAEDNRACYVAEAKLCEVLQASRFELSAGLPETDASVIP